MNSTNIGNLSAQPTVFGSNCINNGGFQNIVNGNNNGSICINNGVSDGVVSLLLQIIQQLTEQNSHLIERVNQYQIELLEYKLGVAQLPPPAKAR